MPKELFQLRVSSRATLTQELEEIARFYRKETGDSWTLANTLEHLVKTEIAHLRMKNAESTVGSDRRDQVQ